MLGSKKITCIIPARLQSTRFPQKVLATLKGKPLLQWVWEAAHKVSFFDQIAFAIDAKETAEVIKTFHGKYYMTSPDCKSGTERLVQLAYEGKIDTDIWVNWQGDEPFIHAQMVHELLQGCRHEKSDIWTLKKRITLREDIESPHITKVVTDREGFGLYFSRSVIPYYREPYPESDKVFFKHIGIYAYTDKALQRIGHLQPSYLEEAEQLEMLRFLYHSLKIKVHETDFDVFGIDIPEHLAKAEAYIDRQNNDFT